MYEMKKLGMDYYDAIREFEKVCDPDNPYRMNDNTLKDMLEKKETTYYAFVEEDKILSGMLTYNTKGKYDYLTIMNIATSPTFRNKGLATSLMKYAEEECKATGLKTVSATAFDDNAVIRKVFAKRGYVQSPFGNPYIYVPKEMHRYTYTNPDYHEVNEKVDEKVKKPAPPKEVIRIKVHPSDSIALTDSKFGGYPYWPGDMEYPVNEAGQKLILLAQINLKDVENPLLPREGLLQFFVSCDDIYGLDEKLGSRVVYHRDIDSLVTEDSVKALGIKAASDLDPEKDEYFPFDGCYGIRFEDGIDYELSEDEDDDEHTTSGSKLLGYPFFTQYDPREEGEYENLLFQMDSTFGEGYEIMWGDAGICNFFINEEDLKKLNFDDVLYNWDCG